MALNDKDGLCPTQSGTVYFPPRLLKAVEVTLDRKSPKSHRGDNSGLDVCCGIGCRNATIPLTIFFGHFLCFLHAHHHIMHAGVCLEVSIHQVSIF